MSPAPPGEHTLPLLETEERASEITQCRESERERDIAESERWWEEEGYYGEIREEGERASKREGERDKETEESERVGEEQRY